MMTTEKLRHSAKPRLGWLLMAVLICDVCGCGNTAKVTGKVTYDGRAVSHGSVIFYSVDRTAHSGVISADGSYTVESVPRGSVKIAVISRNPSKGRSIVRGHETTGKKERSNPTQAVIEGWFPLPARYEGVETSGLGCTIDSSHVIYDIELK